MNNAINELKDFIKNNENINIDFNIDDTNNSIILNFNNELYLQCNNIKKINKIDIINNAFLDSSLYYAIHDYIHSTYTSNNKEYNNTINMKLEKTKNSIFIKVYDNANNYIIFSYKVYIYAIKYDEIDFDEYEDLVLNDYMQILSDDNYTKKLAYDMEMDLFIFNKDFFIKVENLLQINESITIENIKNSYLYNANI